MPVIGETGPVPTSAPIPPTAAPSSQLQPLAPVPPPSSIVAVLGDTRRDGAWRVGRATTVWSGLGDVTLDLRDATFDSPEIDVTVNTLMGDVTVIVAPDTDVVLRGFTLLGDQKTQDFTEGGASGPHVRRVTLRNRGVMGDLKVKIVEPGRTVPSFWTRVRNL